MGIVGKRAEFRVALSAVEGVTGYDASPSIPKPGDAWPVWRGAARDEDGLPFTHTWSVVVTLPTDQTAAEAWTDEHLVELYQALMPVAYIESFAVSNLSPNGQQFALVIITRSE